MRRAILNARARDTKRPSEVKGLRAGGYVPGVLYGFGAAAEPIQIKMAELHPVLKQAHGTTLLIDLEVEGGDGPVTSVIREVQRDPVTREILHCDLLKVDMTRKYLVTVPVVVNGEAVGVKTYGGILDVHLREIEIRCLPGEIPESYEVDVTDLEIGDSIRVDQIAHGTEEFVTHSDVTVVSVAAPRKMVEEEKPEEAEEEAAEAAEEGTEAEEGEGPSKKKEEEKAPESS